MAAVEGKLPFADRVLASWQGRTIATVTGAPNRILEVVGEEVVVATDRSPAGQPVPLSMVQNALDLFERDRRVTVDVETLGHRSAFCGAVLRTIAGVVRIDDSPPVLAWRPVREPVSPTAEDRGAIAAWWDGDADERYWMEITDRPDIGTDLHCPQRDTGEHANPGYSTILLVRNGDIRLPLRPKRPGRYGVVAGRRRRRGCADALGEPPRRHTPARRHRVARAARLVAGP